MSIPIAHLIVDQRLCQGYSRCAVVAPSHFEIGTDAIAIVKKHPEGDAEIQLAKKAVRVCPRRAIRLEMQSPMDVNDEGEKS